MEDLSMDLSFSTCPNQEMHRIGYILYHRSLYILNYPPVARNKPRYSIITRTFN